DSRPREGSAHRPGPRRQSRRTGASRESSGTGPAALAPKLAAVVELLHDDRPGGRGLDAETAENAFVEVLRDERNAVVAFANVEDVDWADLLELGGHLRVGCDPIGHLDVDEDAVLLFGLRLRH